MDLWCNDKVVDFEVRVQSVHTRIFHFIVDRWMLVRWRGQTQTHTHTHTPLHFRFVGEQEAVEEDMSMNMEFLLLDTYKGRIRMTLEEAPPAPRTPPAKEEPLSGAIAKRDSIGKGERVASGKGMDKEHAHAQHHVAAGHSTGHHVVHPAGHPTSHSRGHPAGHPTGHAMGHPAGHPTSHSIGHPAGHNAGNSPGHAAGHAGCHSPEKFEDQKGSSPKMYVGGTPSKNTDGKEDCDGDGSSPFPREFASRLFAVLTIDGVKIPPVEPK